MLKVSWLALTIVLTLGIGGLAVIPALGKVEAKPCHNSADGSIGLHTCDPTPTMDFYTTTDQVNIPPDSDNTLMADCLTGDEVVGGGYVLGNLDGSRPSNYLVSQSGPANENSWWVSVRNNQSFDTIIVTAKARCADLDP